jgi:hypothetical protein
VSVGAHKQAVVHLQHDHTQPPPKHTAQASADTNSHQ